MGLVLETTATGYKKIVATRKKKRIFCLDDGDVGYVRLSLRPECYKSTPAVLFHKVTVEERDTHEPIPLLYSTKWDGTFIPTFCYSKGKLLLYSSP